MSAVEYIGPFKHHIVKVNGWPVPFLTAEPAEDGGVFPSLDNRFCLKVELDDEAEVAPFIADCIAVGLGFTSHPSDATAEPKRRIPYHRLHGMGSIQ